MLPVEEARKNPFAPDLMKGQVAVVTGGGSGIGLATARRAAGSSARGSPSAAASPSSSSRPCASSSALGEIIALPCDIREPESVAAFVGGVLERFGRIDVLVNNAGGQFPTTGASSSRRAAGKRSCATT